MPTSKNPEILNVLEDVIKRAKSHGATDADIVFAESTSLSVARRFGKQESLMRSEETEMGLRVFVDGKMAMVSSADQSPDVLFDMAERAVSMARAVPADPYARVALPSEYIQSDVTLPDLDLYDPTQLSPEKMNDLADAAENAARGIAGVTNSDGAECSFGQDSFYFLTSTGFARGYASSGYSLYTSVVAGHGTAMETEYEAHSATFFEDLKPPTWIGEQAGTRAVNALNPRKGKTCNVPVIFDRRIASGLIGSLASAISGRAVARGTTLLKDKLGQQIFNKDINIIDDPFIKRGNRSHPFDGEGMAPQKRHIIENGVLTGWFLDLATGAQLNLVSTGNARRGVSSPPSPRASNFYMEAGTDSIDALMTDMKEGFFITELMGSGANLITGDYSCGAKGFWIENGAIAYPVSEMTIAGNLIDMWAGVVPANDLSLEYGIDTPSLLIKSMMVGGL